MALPKLDVPTFEIVIPSSKESITMRPFLVKEEKILLMALAGQDPTEMTKATKQIINNCVVSPNFNLDSLEMYDVEFLLLQLRIKSIGETTRIKFQPIPNTKCPECEKARIVEINLTEAKIETAAGHSKKIELNPGMGLLMKYPNAKMLELLEKARASKSLDEVFRVIWTCVECVYSGEDLHKASDEKIEKGVEFLESLSGSQFSKIEVFFQTMPKLKQTVHVKCGICDFNQDFILEGLESFFV